VSARSVSSRSIRPRRFFCRILVASANRENQMPARPKQQHFVTRAYLEAFLEPGQELLFCYGRRRPVAFQARPAGLARVSSYYSVRRPDGTWDDSLEHEIERTVESPGLEVVRTLSASKVELDWAQRDALSLLMAVQRLRVPHLRQILDAAHAELIQRLLTEYDAEELANGPGRLWIRAMRPTEALDSPEGHRAYVEREELEQMRRSLQEDPGQFSRESLFDLAVSFAKVIRRMKWTVHYSSRNSSFITSDCPVLLRHDDADVQVAGIMRKDAHFEFPLSRSSLLSMTHDFALLKHLDRLRQRREVRRALERVPEIRTEQADGSRVQEFNLNQARYSSHWIFCGRRDDSFIRVLTSPTRNVRHRMVREGDLVKLETLVSRP
jgi:hypothetical protein